VQLGCHPGETALLSAAGRHVASRVTGLRYVEGSYDRHILAANLTRQDFTFRYGGWALPLDGPGLGVAVDEAALEAITVESREIRYDCARLRRPEFHGHRWLSVAHRRLGRGRAGAGADCCRARRAEPLGLVSSAGPDPGLVRVHRRVSRPPR